MDISVSNIAWDIEEEAAVAVLLSEAGVRQVDIAPGKYFPDPEAAAPAEIDAVRRLWEDRGFRIAGMQALLFGTSGLNLFSDDDGAMLRRLSAVCRLGGRLGARALTFGSPGNRNRSAVADDAVLPIAVDFFRRVGDVAAEAGVLFCLEPNPAAYNCNFMVTTPETSAMVEAVAHPAVRLQLDVGAIAMNGEDPAAIIPMVAPLIGHIHASEPGLATLGDAGSPHAAAARAIAAARPELTVTVEMAASKTEPHPLAVARAVALAQAAYGAA